MSENLRANQDRDGVESAKQAFSFVRALVAQGLRDFVVSPGSRSTPIVLALKHFPDLRVKVVLDERSAAFYGLGLADRTGEPVALVCTSGTAGANYYPAVIEASEREVPLLLLTADRPLELRDCGAGQTIDQVGLFGKYVRWEVDAVDRSAEQMVSLAEEGYLAAIGDHSGPVHFNLPFREPFLPEGDRRGPAMVGDEANWFSKKIVAKDSDISAMSKFGRGIILAGASTPSDPDRWAEGLFRLSDHLGWPIFADVTNPLRHTPGAEGRVVTQYEVLLSDPSVFEDPERRPDAILQVGLQPTAKILRKWVAGLDGPRWQWTPSRRPLDPSRKPSQWIQGSPAHLGPLTGEPRNGSYRAGWVDMEKGAVRKVQNWLKTVPDSFEGKLYSALLAGVPPESQLFIANSMPVRDAERFWPVDETKRVRVFSNRGASGIDGLVSTVAGLADGGPPTVAVLGDLSFLHDVGGLRVAAAIEGRLDIIVIDNGGGRIFEQLPIHSREDIFEDYFLTPQQVDLSQICAAHGIPAIGFSGVSDLVEAVKAKSTGARVFILKTDPSEDRKVRESWRALWTLREKD